MLALGVMARAQNGGEHRGPTAGAKAGDLRVYFVDVEGGQSTLFVAPDGENLLVDTGSPDRETRMRRAMRAGLRRYASWPG